MHGLCLPAGAPGAAPGPGPSAVRAVGAAANAEVRGGPPAPVDPRLHAAAQDFEGLLLNLLLSAMRQTVPRGALFGNSNELRMYEQLRDEDLSAGMARAGGLGLAPLIEQQLAGQPAAAQQLRVALAAAHDAGRRSLVLDAAGRSPALAPAPAVGAPALSAAALALAPDPDPDQDAPGADAPW
jgi:Rod binding domain-containing protein